MMIFYSYTRRDEGVLNDLIKHLAPLREEFDVDEWWDRSIQAGQDLHEEIDGHLETADLIILMISSHYLASAECMRETKKAMEEKEKRNAIVIPVIVRACAWQDDQEIASLLAVPRDGKPIAQWNDRDEAFHDIYTGIRRIVERIPIRLRATFEDELTKVEFISRKKEDIRLQDLFVFPSMEDRFNESQIQTFADLWTKKKHVILTGDDRSGKSVVCKKLLLDEVGRGKPAILVLGGDITSPVNHENLIEKRFHEQFSGSYSHWRSQQEKLLIIDDFGSVSKVQFIDFAVGFFDRIVVVISEDEYIAYFKEEEEFANFDLFGLKSLSHVAQEELIRNWVSLDDVDQISSDGSIDQIEDKLNSIILHNGIVPRYPFYILTILQSFEAFMPQNLQITAYGHCYQALITAQLVNLEIQPDDIDSSFTFLSSLAFYIFENDGKCGKVQFSRFLREYREHHLVKDSVVNRLINNASILRVMDDEYKFNYPYIYYFLLGSYFAHNYETNEVIIEEIAERSYLKDNAYILIFTIHHAQDDSLIDTILLHTACALDHVPVATLDIEETRLLESALMQLPERIVSKQSVGEERRAERIERDELESNAGSGVTEEGHEAEQLSEEGVNEIYKSLKNMEIMGQVLRNKYGSLQRDKIEVAIEWVTEAGLRMVRLLTDSNGIQSLEGILLGMADRAEVSRDDKVRLEHFVRTRVRAIVLIGVSALLAKVVVSIRKPELQEIVGPMFRRRSTPAYDVLYTLFLLATSEDIPARRMREIIEVIEGLRKSNNTVAFRLISLAVQHYANTHHIERISREKLFGALGIDYRPNRPGLKARRGR